jgi:hypothetical protein
MSVPDLSKLATNRYANHRVGEATPLHPETTVIDRVIVVLKPEGDFTRNDVAVVLAYAQEAAEQAARVPPRSQIIH